MSDDLPLPEDLGAWPSDPWELLGVARGTDRREIRRAYARRIRVYRPEHRPEEFRRIRDAYERLDAMAEGTPSADMEGSPAAPPSEAPHRPGDPREVAWRAAEEGRPDEAYGELRTLWESGGRRDDELCARLYWLRRLDPGADPAVHRRDILCDGLRGGGFPDRLMELYWRELFSDPAEAFSPRYEALLEAPAAPGRRGDLLAIRWQAASALGRFDAFADDIARARRQLAHVDDAMWVSVLLWAMDHLAWETEEPHMDLYHACRKEASAAAEGHLQLDAAFDRAEFLAEMAAGYHRLRVAPGKLGPFAARLLPLLRTSWTQPTARWRPLLIGWLADALVEPLATLERLDAVSNLAPALLMRLASIVETLDRQRRDPETAVPAEQRTKGVREFLQAYGISDYATFRRTVLCSCLWDRITTAEFAESLSEILEPDVLERTGLRRTLEGDLPLALLSRGALALWP